jgi:DNA repair exonuclease SbcCD ATPase subunit
MKWLKRFFQQKMTMEQAKGWLAEEQKKQSQEQKQATEDFSKAFPELITAAKQSIAALERAELRNPNIPERAKHYMTGNREQFIKLTTRFAENLIVPKEAPDFSQIDLLFHEYAQNTARPSTILSEFLGEEVKQIRKALAEIEAGLHEIKKLQIKKEQLHGISDLIKRIEGIHTERESLAKQKQELEAQVQQLIQKRDNIRKEKEAFIQRPDYLKIKEDIVATAKERQEAEQEITNLFSPLTDAIKKFAHNTKNDKLAKYAENPLDALIHDYALGILKHVQEIKTAIETGKIELKPERVPKALESLSQLSKEKLGNMIHRYANSKKRETDVHHDVAQRDLMKEYEQYAVDLKNVNNEITAIQSAIEKLKMPTDEELRAILAQELEKHDIALV